MSRQRYRLDKIHAASLEGNPVNSPVDRDLFIYLPPDYYDPGNKKYPVVYLLHGYTGNEKNMAVPENQRKRFDWAPTAILEKFDWPRICDYVKLDELISGGHMKPFILVQPDGSLHLPDKNTTHDLWSGTTRTKGSFYVNSKYTGNFEDYILNDVIPFVDGNYRTLAGRKNRALMGVSMGGYGTLSIISRHPEKFCAAAALSPANFTVGMLDWKLLLPMAVTAFGREAAEKAGKQLYDDILDTQDMIFHGERGLMSTVIRGSDGRVVSFDEQLAEASREFDINRIAEKYAANLKQIPLMMNCETSDEFGLAMATATLHETFLRLGIPHEYEIYCDPAAAELSPHILGIAYNIIPAIKFCLGHIG